MMAQCHAQGRGPAGSPRRPPPGAGLTKPGMPSATSPSPGHQRLSQKTRPHPASSHVPSRWRCGQEQTPINLRAGQLARGVRGWGGNPHSLRTAHKGSPYPQNRGGAELAAAYGLKGGEVSEIDSLARDKQSSRVASSCLCRTTVAAPTPRSSSWGGAGGPRSVRREDVRALL